MGEWPTTPLEDVVDEILDRRGVTPLKLGSDFTAEGHRVISAKLIKGRTVDLAADEARFVDTPTYRKWMRTPLAADDVILTSEAPLGEVAYIPADIDWVLGQRLFAIRTDKRRLIGRFLYYALQAAPARNDLLTRATGTTAQGIRQSELRRVRVPIPPLSAQLRIAGILGALDDKIELNLRTSEALEGAAQALFKSWFLDSEPDASDQDGSLADAVDLLRDLVDPQLEPDTVFQHYSLPAYDAGREAVSEPGAGIRSSKLAVLRGSVLLSKLNPDIERVWLPDIRPDDRAICSTEFLVLRPRVGVGRAFVYEFLRSASFRNTLTSLVTGTTGSHQRAHAEAILQVQLRLPSPSRAAAFEGLVGPMLDRISAARRESSTLVGLRGALLPRLLSGETSPSFGRDQGA